MNKECRDCPAALSYATVEAKLAFHINSLIQRESRVQAEDARLSEQDLFSAEVVLAGDKTAEQAEGLEIPADKRAWIADEEQLIAEQCVSIDRVSQTIMNVRRLLRDRGASCLRGPNSMGVVGCGVRAIREAEQEMNQAFNDHMRLTVGLGGNNTATEHPVVVVDDSGLTDR